VGREKNFLLKISRSVWGKKYDRCKGPFTSMISDLITSEATQLAVAANRSDETACDLLRSDRSQPWRTGSLHGALGRDEMSDVMNAP